MLYMTDKLIQQLESYRLENKITQEELAKKLGVAFSTVNRWLNGKTTPNKIQQYHIEKFLKSTSGSKKRHDRIQQFVKRTVNSRD